MVFVYTGFGFAFMIPIADFILKLVISYKRQKDYLAIGQAQDIERLVK